MPSDSSIGPDGSAGPTVAENGSDALAGDGEKEEDHDNIFP
jgi:hypothetical protein